MKTIPKNLRLNRYRADASALPAASWNGRAIASSLCRSLFVLFIFLGQPFFPSTSHAQAENKIQSAGEYQHRGIELFRQGRFAEAIEAFDQVIALNPRLAPGHWQRGIACYYAGQYEKGVQQFELHQTVNPQDVENAAWHFICKARLEGIEAARESLIPIRHDSRVPMNEIWQLFAGLGTEEEVMKAARIPSGERLRQALCYAHLYLGLYYEALGKPELAKEHIHLAAHKFSMDNYMGMVAQVHDRFLMK